MSTPFRRLLLSVLVALALVPSGADAQADPERRPQGDRAQLEARVRSQMARVMRERLGLTEEQSAELTELTSDFENRRRELFGLEQATRRRVEALLLEGGDDQDEARQLIARMGELREREASLFREGQDALLDVLTPVQVLQLQELRQDLGRRIRALGGGPDGRPGGPGGDLPARGGRPGGGGSPRRSPPGGGR